MTVTAIEKPRLSAKVIKEIDLCLEDIYPQAQKVGNELVDCKMDKSQVRGLENIIVATTRFSEIINYVKNQAGKEKKDNKWRTIAPIILEDFEKIEAKAIDIAGDDPSRRLEVKLRLVKGWARQVVAHYLYGKNDGGGNHDV